MATNQIKKEEQAKVLEEGDLDLGEINKNNTIEEFKEFARTTPQSISNYSEKESKASKREDQDSTHELTSCLRNERVIVRHVNKASNSIIDPKHILYGGMIEGAVKYYTVPKLESSKMFFNVLTDSEKAYLEHVMGLEYNALSVYKKIDNYWENRLVRLTKSDNYLDLRNPEQYIEYKILLANKDFIAPSLQDLADKPKATYEYVIVREEEEDNLTKKSLTSTMKAYMEYGKVQDNKDILFHVVESMEGKPLSSNTKMDALQVKVSKLIQANPGVFLKIVTDEYLDAKVLIKKCVYYKLITNRSGFYYLASDGSQLCDKGDDPTLKNAAIYLASPRNQELMFRLQGKVTELKS